MKRLRTVLLLLAALAVVLLIPALPSGQEPGFNESFFARLAWRNLGPFRTGAWTTAIAVPEAPLDVAPLHLLRRHAERRGLEDDEQRDDVRAGVRRPAVAVDRRDRGRARPTRTIVWVGTGEAYQARSSYSGDGVYKSIDAGKTWTNMGLRESHHISRIVIHPKNPDIVYVAAMGHLYSPNAERGLFVTEDGGRTWKKSLYVDEKTGVIDARDEPPGPERALRGDVRADAQAVGPRHRRPGQRHLEDDRRRPDVDEARRRPAHGADRPHRHRSLPGEPEHPLRDRREREPAQAHRPGGEARRRPAETQRVRRRQRGVPHRRRRAGRGGRRTPTSISIGSKAAYSFNILRVDPGDANHVAVISDAMPNSSDGGKTWQGTSWPPQGHVREGVRRLPGALVGPAEPGPDPGRQRRRLLRVLRPRARRRITT